MRLSILGPLDVRDETGAPVALRSPKQRLLLACLVARPDEPLSTARLLDSVWAGEPPASARKALGWHLAKLRATLDTPGLIVHDTNGYRLDSLLSDIDSLRFVDRFREAVAIVDTAPGAAERALSEALALWRGAAFEEFADNPFLREAASDLEELRLRAVECRNRARLALGGHHALIGDLTRLVERHPLRESLRAQLMLAMYRDGRADDALRAHREGARLLNHQFGLEPGPRLRTLADRIADSSPLLGLPEHTTRSEAFPTPPADFTGRGSVRDAIIAAADRRPPHGPAVIAVHGMAGVGKTTIVTEAARSWLRDRFDHTLFVNLRGFSTGPAPMPTGEALARLLTDLGVTRIPRHVDERAARYRTAMAHRRTLVILDDVADVAQVIPLLPGGSGNLVLLTSRRSLSGIDDLQQVPVDVLDPVEAATMFRTVAGSGPAADASETVVADIVAACGGLPLGIRLAAARLTSGPGWTAERLRDRLTAQRHRLRELDSGGHSVAAAFHMSYQDLDPEARRLFRLASVAGGHPFGTSAIASVCGIDVADAEARLDRLVDASLLECPAADRFGFHDLIADYAAEAAERDEPAGALDAARERLSDHYLHSGHHAAMAFHPLRRRFTLPPVPGDVVVDSVRDPSEALAWLSDHHGPVMTAIADAAAAGRHRQVIGLSWLLTTFFERRGHWHDWIDADRAALRAARALGDVGAQAQAHSNLARAHSLLGDVDAASTEFTEALRLFDICADRRARAHTFINYSRLFESDDLPAALRHAEAGLQILTELSDEVGRAAALTAIAWYAACLDDLDRARSCAEAALRFYRSTGQHSGQAAVLHTLGTVNQRQGFHRAARDHFDRCLAEFRAGGNRAGEAQILQRLAEVLDDGGEPEAARQARRQSADILEELADAPVRIAAPRRRASGG